jgi:hypothetical protein
VNLLNDAPTPDRPILRPFREEGRPQPVIASLVLLGLSAVGYGYVALATILARPRYLPKLARAGGLTVPQQLFLESPGSVFVAAFLVLVVGLLFKEVAIERKTLTLKLNLLALAGAAALVVLFHATVKQPADRLP